MECLVDVREGAHGCAGPDSVFGLCFECVASACELDGACLAYPHGCYFELEVVGEPFFGVGLCADCFVRPCGECADAG